MGKKSNKSVCFICYRSFPDTNFEHYSKAVSDAGYDVTVVAYLEDGQLPREYCGERKIIRIPVPGDPFTRKSRLVFTMELVKFLRKNEFSIIHIHHTCAYFAIFKLLLLHRHQTKFLYHITSHPITKSRFSAKRQILRDFLQCLLMDEVIIQSEELKEKLPGIGSLKRSHVVPVGFNHKYFYPIADNLKDEIRQELQVDENEPLLVYCGAIGKNRHLNRLIEAFALVRKEYANARLLMIGDGNFFLEIKKFVRQLHLENHVIFTGKVLHQKVAHYMGIADLALSYVPINQSYTYNPPLKTFEYLACGLPTLATRTESNSRIIKDGFNGVLVNDRPEDLAAAIIKLLKNKERLIQLKANSRNGIMEFDFEHITQKNLIPIYENLLAVSSA